MNKSVMPPEFKNIEKFIGQRINDDIIKEILNNVKCRRYRIYRRDCAYTMDYDLSRLNISTTADTENGVITGYHFG